VGSSVVGVVGFDVPVSEYVSSTTERRGHPRPFVCRVPLSRPEWISVGSARVLAGEIGRLTAKSTLTVDERRVVSPFAVFGGMVVIDPSSRIRLLSAWAAAWRCSNSTGGRSPSELCSRAWLNHATQATVASSSCARLR
jgi:hypothetical protein